MSRVFDALCKVSCDPVAQELAFSAASIDDLERTFTTDSIASVTMMPGAKSRLAFQTDPYGPAAERYRLLRMQLRAFHGTGKLKILLITSAEPKAGKSTVALNLASALAEKGNAKVLLLEADLRRPSLAQELGVKLPNGLSQCAKTDAGLLSAIRRVEPAGFFLLPGGKPSDHPAEVLNSEWFSENLKKLQFAFDWVLIDSPPGIPVVDTLSIRDHADAILLVMRAGQTQQPAVEEVLRVLGTDRLLGVVLNGAEGLDHGYYEYYNSHSPGRPSTC